MKIQSRQIVQRTAAIAAIVTCFFLVPVILGNNNAWAATAKEIDVSVDVALERFHNEIKGGKEFLASAKGVLVFPSVVKAAIGIGGEFGEGALRIGGKTVAYYNTAAASFGLQLGAESKSIILVFLQEDALKKFRASEGWKVGVDGSVALFNVGAGGRLDTTTVKDPIVGFVFGQKGLMADISLSGAKMTKINK
jgi:lipid-binding SYLF domain-containing protein